MDKWFNVNENARIWAGHSDAHKQGWLYAPAAIRAIEVYKGSYRFEDWKVEGDGRADFEASSNYPDFWIRIEDVSLDPFPVGTDPVPTPDPSPGPVISDAELGAAFRTIITFIADVFA